MPLETKDSLLNLHKVINLFSDAFYTKMSLSGMGRHIVCLTEEQIFAVLKWSTLAQILEMIALAFVKVSICLFMIRMIQHTMKRVRQGLWILIGLIIACHIAVFFLFVLQCVPLTAVWDPSVSGKCYGLGLTYSVAYWGVGTLFLTGFRVMLIKLRPRCIYGLDICYHTNLRDPASQNQSSYKDRNRFPDGTGCRVRVFSMLSNLANNYLEQPPVPSPKRSLYRACSDLTIHV